MSIAVAIGIVAVLAIGVLLWFQERSVRRIAASHRVWEADA